MFDLEGYGYGIIVEGAGVTLFVALSSLFIAVLLGMAAALAKLSNSPMAQIIAGTYTTVIRGVPDLVLMLLIFFGGQIFINNLPDNILELLLYIGEKTSQGDALKTAMAPYLDWGYIDVNPLIAGVLTIGFIFGAYMGETFRGAIMAVDRGMLEAGTAYGMTRIQITRRILIPQMMRHALPGFGNNWLVLMKATALVSIIGLSDMVRRAGLAAGATREPFKYYLVVALVFLFFTTLSIWFLKWAERRYSVGVRRIS
ncbi:ABC transporter permease [Kiloniella laminariae]|uniref:ABC transporter permease n=1 Tax=Kiloniella laminariae TaxID=454162 RepID=UPI00035F3CE9|nr:ABC transporter permease [Kiloniella laminariae]